MTNLLLFVAFFKMGLFGYGGGMGMLPLIFQTVRDFCLVSEKQISDLVGISQVSAIRRDDVGWFSRWCCLVISSLKSSSSESYRLSIILSDRKSTR